MDEQLDRDDAANPGDGACVTSGPINYVDHGIPQFMMVFMICLVAALLVANIYLFSLIPRSTTTVDNVQAAQDNAQAKEIEFQLESHRQDQALRMNAAKRCSDNGNIPVILNGNVDCRIGPKK